MSRSDRIVEIEIDDQRRLCVTPATAAFPLIYREAMDVGWDAENERLCSAIPVEWSYQRWFQQLVAAAKAQGVELVLDSRTKWTNVPDGTKMSILQAHSNPNARDAD